MYKHMSVVLSLLMCVTALVGVVTGLYRVQQKPRHGEELYATW